MAFSIGQDSIRILQDKKAVSEIVGCPTSFSTPCGNVEAYIPTNTQIQYMAHKYMEQ